MASRGGTEVDLVPRVLCARAYMCACVCACARRMRDLRACALLGSRRHDTSYAHQVPAAPPPTKYPKPRLPGATGSTAAEYPLGIDMFGLANGPQHRLPAASAYSIGCLPPPAYSIGCLPPPAYSIGCLPPPAYSIGCLPPPAYSIGCLPPPAFSIGCATAHRTLCGLTTWSACS